MSDIPPLNHDLIDLEPTWWAEGLVLTDHSLLPPNASPLEKAVEAAIQVPALAVPLRDLWDPWACPLDILPWLAWGLSIDNWESAWSEPEKRARVATAIADQKRKGSRASVQKELDALGGFVTLTEWFEKTPAGQPYTFDLVLNTSDPAAPRTAAYVDQVIGRLSRIKPVRAHGRFIMPVSATCALGLEAAVRPALFARLETVEA